MTTKFLVTSLLGVSSLGEAIAGGIYLSRDNTSSKIEESPKVSINDSQTSGTKAPTPTKPDAPETVPQVKTNPEPVATETRQSTELQTTQQRDGAVASWEAQRLTR